MFEELVICCGCNIFFDLLRLPHGKITTLIFDSCFTFIMYYFWCTFVSGCRWGIFWLLIGCNIVCWCFLSFCGVSDFFSFSLFTLLILSDIYFLMISYSINFYKFQIQVSFSIYPLVSLIVFLNWEIESEIKHLNSLIFLCAELRYPFSCLFSSCSC